MSENDFSLRPEAGPVPYWKHHQRAKESLNFIIRVLKGAADSAHVNTAVDPDLMIDTNRASRIVFVSGEPGSGKSTLYLTLKAMLSSKEKEKYQVGYKGEGKVNLNDLKGVRWLDALDLEVAGDEGENLLAAVLVRIFRALDESSTVHSKNCEDAIKELEELASDIGIAWEGNLQARAGALDPATYSEEVMRTQRARLGVNERLRNALDKLAEKECYGCGPGTLFVLPVDDFYLKPDASLQLLRLLRMISIPRLFFLVMGDINTVEALFIEKSLADWTAVAGTRLFAARSDRLDKALTRARELRARYLRKLLPPGQRAVIEAMDWYEALNFEVSRPASAEGAVEILEELLLNVKLDEPFRGSNEANKTESLLEFLISPSLPPLTAEEKVKRKKRAQGDDDAENELSEERALKKHQAAYTALQILDATPREMMDLGSAFREVVRSKKEVDALKKDGSLAMDESIPPLLLCVTDIVNHVKEEQQFLNEKEQEVLEGIPSTRNYSPEDINFSMDRLDLRPDARGWKKQDSERLWIRKHRSWLLGVNNKFVSDKGTKSDHTAEVKDATTDPFAKLPPRPAAWFVLLHDLAWKWNPDSLTGNLVQKLEKDLDEWYWERNRESDVASSLKPEDGPEAPLGVMEDAAKRFIDLFERFVHQSDKTIAESLQEKDEPDPTTDFPGWSVWYDEVDKKYKHFKIPEFQTFRDLDCFLHIWSHGLEELEKVGPLASIGAKKISSLWALAGWTVLAGAYRNYARGSKEWCNEFVETTGTFDVRFQNLKDKLGEGEKVFEYPTENDAAITKWVEEVGKWPDQFQTV